MCLDSPFVFYKWNICCWNEQQTVNGNFDFEDLILKLGWMIWAIIYYAHHLVCLDHRYILYNLVQGLILKGGVLNHSTVVFMKLFCSCCMLPCVSLCMHHCFQSQTHFELIFKADWHNLNMNIKIMVFLWFGTSSCLMNVFCVWGTSLRWD